VKGGKNGPRTALALLRFIPLILSCRRPFCAAQRVFGEEALLPV